MTFAEIKAEIVRRLAEGTERVFWSDDDIATAANLGYAEISDATEWNEQWVDLALMADRPYYDLRRLIGDDFLAIRPAFDRQTNRWLIPTVVSQLDTSDRRWERVTGEPQRIFTRGLWWLGFYPRLTSEIGQIKQYFTALPEPLEDDDDEPGFPDTFHHGIVEFALTDLWAQDGEATLALLHWASYLAIEAALTAWMEGRAADPMHRGFETH